VHDGSIGRTAEVAGQFASSDVLVVSRDNGGPQMACNHAYKLSQGDYMQWLGADDLLVPDEIERQLAALRETNSRRTLLSSPRGFFYYRTGRALGPDIIGLGWLEDPGDEIASWSAMIVPIKVGGGTRVKVAEGFARRCPVVATTIGAFGYDVENGREILLADRADDFASACILLLRDPEFGEALAERAHKRFLERWTWDSFEGTVGRVVQECLARSADAQYGQAAPRTPRLQVTGSRERS